MQDENIMKMAERADIEIKDVPTLNILICYLLYKIDRPVETEQLYEIAIGTGVVNYFYYQDSIDYLLKNSLISLSVNSSGVECYSLEDKGRECARRLKNYAPKSYRDKLVLAALRYFARQKAEQEIKIDYIPLDKGCYVNVRCLDADCDLMDLKLYAPDMTQAKMLGERIMLNPAGFYGKIVELALSNEEVPYDLSDN
ncbi:MAG: DUF4364 family protein [Ruminococcus sp.]|nr:DUF4364 family protein [Ruminococcus sp.]MBQ3947119.1 DUF4364 family protein [Ruminococcus sp.]MBR6393828.1 DUF4364 family protein [Ruminococcus sp.]MCR5728934.1 DUF4364 family protein [Ruminococcus sp.]